MKYTPLQKFIAIILENTPPSSYSILLPFCLSFHINFRDGNPDLGFGIRPIFEQILESEFGFGIRFLIADSGFLIGRLELQQLLYLPNITQYLLTPPQREWQNFNAKLTQLQGKMMCTQLILYLKYIVS